MSKKRGGLGRGLSALIPNVPPEDERYHGQMTVPVGSITPNPHQPRSLMDEGQLAELVDSIVEHGLIQPLIVTQTGPDTFALIAGERRWRAAQRAGLREVPVVVKEASPQAMLELAIIENVQRADLNPLEEAIAYQQLIDEFGLTQAQVAERVGKSRPTVANLVRLLNLPQNVQKAVVEGKISGAHARCLVSLPTAEIQTTVLSTIMKKGLSVRQTESLVRKLLAGKKTKPKAARKLPPEMSSLEDQFRRSLGTRVRIQPGAGSGGKIVIHYYSDEELQAIYDAIVDED